LIAGLLAGTGCKPDLDQVVSIVSGPRVLGIQANPAEAPPMSQVSFDALVVDENGPIAHPPTEWAFCDVRNPLANLGPDDPSCLEPSTMPDPEAGTGGLLPFGGGAAAIGTVPQDVCSQFGPNPPAPLPGQPPGRPVDPDPTGGYYAPVSYFLQTPSSTIGTIYPMRLTCGFAGVDPTSLGQLTTRYHANVNPKVDTLTITHGAGGMPQVLQPDPATNQIAVGEKLALEVAWPGCPATDTCGDNVCGPDETTTNCSADCKMPAVPGEGCAGAERYVNFDLASQSVIDAREGIHVAWYATGGSFDADRTGREGTDMVTTSDNGWRAPSAAGTVHLWVVLADDRGGVGWEGFTLAVQ
jgi:hypothetical protein